MAIRFTPSTGSRRTKSQLGFGGIIFGLFWTAFSSIFVVIGLKGSFTEAEQSQWPTVPCEVLEFKVDDHKNDEPAFQPMVRFKYAWEGVEYEGDKVWLKKEGVDEYIDLMELIDAAHYGEITSCFVNPENPNEAMLFTDPGSMVGGIVFAVFGGCFVLIGIGVLSMSIKGLYQKKKAISSGTSHKEGRSIGLPFFGLFGAAGFGVLFFVIVPMWQQYLAAKSWEPCEAKVIWSTVRSHSDSDGTTYSPDVFYRYKFDDRVYKSNKVDIFSGSSSGYDGKRDFIANYKKGTKFTCYVNPQNPHESLIQRELGWWALFTLFPLPFIAVGVGGIYFTLRKKKAKTQGAGLRQTRDTIPTNITNSSQSFSPGKKRFLGIIGILCVGLFWNGIVSVFLNEVLQAWQRGNPDWFLTLFLVPFVAVGLFLIGYFFYKLMAAFNPAPALELSPGAITLGSSAKITWMTNGGEQKLRQFQIFLVGEEEAQYRQGKNTHKKVSIFHEALLVETQDPRKVRHGSTEFTLPLDTAPSWKGTSISINWYLRVKGDISLWPDINDQYEVTIVSSKN